MWKYWFFTVEPRFNEVLRDWGNFFIISRVRYIENLYLTSFLKNNQGARYIGEQLLIIIIPTKYFPDSDWLKAHA